MSLLPDEVVSASRCGTWMAITRSQPGLVPDIAGYQCTGHVAVTLPTFPRILLQAARSRFHDEYVCLFLREPLPKQK